MQDRMNMRDRMEKALNWPDTPGEKPDSQKWRSEFDRDPEGILGAPPRMYHNPDDICRSTRVFIARKQ